MEDHNQHNHTHDSSTGGGNNHNHSHADHAGHGKSNTDNQMLMGILSYIGPLVIVSYLTSKNDPVVKFHIKQGLVLFIIEILFWILMPMLYYLWIILRLINLATIVLSVVGIVNVVNKKQKMLPVVGGLAKYFKF